MRIVKISQAFFETFPPTEYELLSNFENGKYRPYFVILKLKYKGIKRPFAIPFRSNMSGGVPANEYFPLPPRHTTKPNRKHALHYTKMFPIDKKYFEKYNTDSNDTFYTVITKKINKNINSIVESAQLYLTDYESGQRCEMASKIDDILLTLDEEKNLLKQ